jgi:isopentenyl-diphosphate delta-isomerase
VESHDLSSGFHRYYFVHQALPEIDMADVDLSTIFLGKCLKAPIIISSMTGGTKASASINRNLALAAQELGLGMGVGSQRAALEDASLAYTYRVRDVAPDILLFANLGAVQLNYGYSIKHCQQAVEMIGADAVILHLNPLQEALQGDGETNFKGLLAKIEKICRALSLPVIVKEVGCGISVQVARKLIEVGVAAIDVAGAGGTVWSEVERLCLVEEKAKNIATAFSSWGIPTAESIKMVAQVAKTIPVIGSGGVRTGIDVAKAIALGADIVGIAEPVLRAASMSHKAVIDLLTEIKEELRICLFCLGLSSPAQLKGSPLLVESSHRG